MLYGLSTNHLHDKKTGEPAFLPGCAPTVPRDCGVTRSFVPSRFL